jgi:hypothetical protein
MFSRVAADPSVVVRRWSFATQIVANDQRSVTNGQRHFGAQL